MTPHCIVHKAVYLLSLKYDGNASAKSYSTSQYTFYRWCLNPMQGHIAIKNACAIIRAPVVCAHPIFLTSTGNYAVSEMLDLFAQLPENQPMGKKIGKIKKRA